MVASVDSRGNLALWNGNLGVVLVEHAISPSRLVALDMGTYDGGVVALLGGDESVAVLASVGAEVKELLR